MPYHQSVQPSDPVPCLILSHGRTIFHVARLFSPHPNPLCFDGGSFATSPSSSSYFFFMLTIIHHLIASPLCQQLVTVLSIGLCFRNDQHQRFPVF